MDQSTKVTIILSAYNRPIWVTRAINSVINQTEKDWELIVIDDFSPELKTWKKLQEYAVSDKRIKVFRNEINMGSICKIPYMLSSTSEYISLLDDDDYWEPQYLETLIRVLNSNKDKHIASCNIEKIFPNGQTRVLDVSKGRPFPNALPSCTIYRGSTYRELGGLDLEFKEYHSEAEYFYRCGGYKSFIHVNKVLVHVTFSPGAMSSNKKMSAYYLEKLVSKHYGTLKYKKRELADYYARIGAHYTEAGLNKSYYFIKAIKTNPLIFEAWGALILLLISKRLFLRLYNLYRRIGGY